MERVRVQHERGEGDDVDRLCAAEEMGVVGVVLRPDLLRDAVNHLALAGDQELRQERSERAIERHPLEVVQGDEGAEDLDILRLRAANDLACRRGIDGGCVEQEARKLLGVSLQSECSWKNLRTFFSLRLKT